MRRRIFLHVLVIAFLFSMLYLASRFNYLLFHATVEIFSLVIAFSIFILVLNIRRYLVNHYFFILGVAYLFVGAVDLLHLLAYEGMQIFGVGETNLATQLWIIARYGESISLLIATYFTIRKARLAVLFAIYFIVHIAILSSVFVFDIFPVCYRVETGLTTFKIINEYVIIAILGFALWGLIKNRSSFDRTVMRLLAGSIITTIFAESSFTLYVSAYGTANMIGHFLKVLSFYFIYRAIIQVGIQHPFSSFFRELTQKERKLLEYQSELEKLVEKRTMQLNETVERLLENEKRLEYALEATTDGVWDWNIKSGEVYFSPKWINSLGYSEEEVPNHVSFWEDIIHPDDVSRVRDALQEHFEGRTSLYQIENRLRRKSGEYRWNLDRGKVVERDANGNPVRMVGADSDITERKKAQETLLMNERLLRKAYEVANSGTWYYDFAKNEVSWSEGFCEMLGIPLNVSLTYEMYLELIHPDDRDYVKTKWLLALEGGSYDEEHRIVVENEVLWVRSKVEIEYDDTGRPRRALGVTQDITNRKISEQDAEILRSELAHISRIATIGELTSAIAHELNQPLTAILNNAETGLHLLAEGNADVEELNDIFADIASDDKRAGDVITKLRALLIKSTKERDYSPIDINKLIEGVLTILNSELVFRKIALKKDLSDAIPPVKGDGVQLQQVVLNLIGNAFDAMNNAQIRSLLIYTKQSDSLNIEVGISDSGSGFDKEKSQQLFNPFYSTKKNGLGMGLAICKAIIEDHQGQIGIRNNADKGSTSFFTLRIYEEGSA
jgi:PAS domain S-box-containing protein